MKKLTILLILCNLSLCAFSKTIYVDANGTGDYPTIQAAINNANDGDEIILLPGTYIGDGNRDIDYTGKAITVRSIDPSDPCVVEATIIDCQQQGRGFYFHNGETTKSILDGLTIINGYISGNWPLNGGGGIYCGSCGPTISNCILECNSATYGGGMFIYSFAKPVITNCIFNDNVAVERGGGIYNSDNSNTLITNCIFAGNRAETDRGGGFFNGNQGNPKLINCTFTGNQAEESYGGGVCNFNPHQSFVTLTNCIFWLNIDSGGIDESAQVHGEPIVISYCCIQGLASIEGIGNIGDEPLFAGLDDYRLLPDSPCIDAGDNTAVPSGVTTDLDGNPRFVDDPFTEDTGHGTPPIVDMGAYEYEFSTEETVILAKPDQIKFFAVPNEPNVPPKMLSICNIGVGTLNWQITEDCPWLYISPSNGSSTGEIDLVTLTVDTEDLPTGQYTCDLMVSDDAAANSPVVISVLLVIHSVGRLHVPTECSTIQEAIDVANAGDTVLIADGVYTGKGNRDIDFSGKAITVQSENGPENCIVDCQNLGRGFYFHSSEDTNSILEGLTITKGYKGGGGIYCKKSGPIIKNCIIANNFAPDDGGGVHSYDSSVTIINCLFQGNSAVDFGGGIYTWGRAAKIKNCVFENNSADRGGGILYQSSSVCPSNYSTNISNCIFSNNSASRGGGICYQASKNKNMMITNCTFASNSGSAVYLYWTTATMTNCVLWDNPDFDIKLTECSSKSENYCISKFTVSYTDIQGGSSAVYKASHCSLNWGIGNIDSDPCFVDSDANDFHLLSESPCINAGDPDCILEPNETDLDGNDRISNDRIDMGCYEFQFNHQPVAVAGPNQVVYVCDEDELAEVHLDGLGSYDDDGDELDYYWSWVIDGNVVEANGVAPTIQLPVGEHEIELVVDDGTELSEPDYCIVTVVEPLRARLFCRPSLLNTRSRRGIITAFVCIPDVTPEDINTNEPLIFMPGGIESKRQFVFQWHGRGCTWIIASFYKGDCMDNLSPGMNKIKVTGRLNSGQCYYGDSRIFVFEPRRFRYWRKF